MANYLAIASNKREAEEIQRYSEGLGNCDKIVFLSYKPFESPEACKKAEFKIATDFLNREDFQEIEERAAYFTRNWHRFDKNFSAQTTFNGISLGFAHENHFFYFFRRIFFITKAVRRIIEEHKPAAVIANKNGQFKQYISTISEAGPFPNTIWLDLKQEQKYTKHPNLNPKKLKEIRHKLPLTLKKLLNRQKTTGKKTVFIRSRGYMESLKQQLKKDNSFNVVSLDEFLLGKLLNPVNAYRHISTKRAMKKKFSQAFEEFKSTKAFNEKFVFNGTNFKKAIGTHLSQVAERDWPELVCLTKALSGLFKAKKPSLVILWVDSVPFERICALLARQNRAKSLVFQHGIFEPILEKGDWIAGYAPMTADKIAVWGNMFKKALEKHGTNPEKITVTGAPRFDGLATRKFDRKKTRESLKVKEDEKLIVLATSYDLNTEELQAILDEATGPEPPKKSLVVKIHHVESLSNYAWMQNKAKVVQNTDLYELLNASDAVIVKSSTVGLEAMLLGKPVILFGKKPLADNAFESTEAVLKATDKRELSQALQTALSSKGMKTQQEKIREFAYNTAFKNDGQASKRALSLIKEMANQI